MASTPPARGAEADGRFRARLKMGRMEGFWNLGGSQWWGWEEGVVGHVHGVHYAGVVEFL
jgi:hypothetical protein